MNQVQTNGKDWETLTSYRCVRCNKVYHSDPPDKCICRSPYEIGNLLGPFKITGAKDEDGKIPVVCLICDCSKDIHYTGLKRQKSCGCKPKWIDVLDISEEFVRYRCSKCGQISTDELPVINYCCE